MDDMEVAESRAPGSIISYPTWLWKMMALGSGALGTLGPGGEPLEVHLGMSCMMFLWLVMLTQLMMMSP